MMQSEILIQSLKEQTKKIIIQVENLKTFDLQKLTWKENENSWSVLECIEHLNLYGDFYLPQINNKIKQTNSQFEKNFRSGWLGNYFAKSMLKTENSKRMKTAKDKNPQNLKLDKTVIEKFLGQLNYLLDLLDKSKNVSLNKARVPTSFSKIIKIKLGDAFQFFINHIIRHLKQIDRILTVMKVAKKNIHDFR